MIKEALMSWTDIYCFFFPVDEPVSHQWIYPGQCPHSLGEWAWVPFRNHCYAFNLQSLKLQQDARTSCIKSMEAFQRQPQPSTTVTLPTRLMTLT